MFQNKYEKADKEATKKAKTTYLERFHEQLLYSRIQLQNVG
jgi:hypothetical protein